MGRRSLPSWRQSLPSPSPTSRRERRTRRTLPGLLRCGRWPDAPRRTPTPNAVRAVASGHGGTSRRVATRRIVRNQFLPPPQRAWLAIENVFKAKSPLPEQRFRLVLCWLENDGDGRDTRTVADAFTSIEGIELVRSACVVSASGLFTGIINMLIEAHVDGYPVDYDPRKLTTVTRDGVPLRTLSRRVDGAMPGHVDPIAIWEIKEYYYTTTFGSRVADGVYETLLDGMELKEITHREGIDVEHILMVDAKYTWWDCGKSYLCRIIDMLHMGYVDEVLFGREVVERIPLLAASWGARYRERDHRA